MLAIVGAPLLDSPLLGEDDDDAVAEGRCFALLLLEDVVPPLVVAELEPARGAGASAIEVEGNGDKVCE